MRHGSLTPVGSLALGISMFCCVAASAAPERSRDAAPVTMTPQRAALLSAKATAVPMPQTSIGWVKACPVVDRREDCSVSGGFALKPEAPPALQLTLNLRRDDGTRSLAVLLPLDVQLRAGFTLAFDDGRAVLGDYTSCSAIGCSGEIGLNDAQYEQLLRDRHVGLLIGNHQNTALRLEVPLAGLTAAVDGPAMPAAEMVRRHDEASKQWQAFAKAARDASAAKRAAANPGGEAKAADAPTSGVASSEPPKSP